MSLSTDGDQSVAPLVKVHAIWHRQSLHLCALQEGNCTAALEAPALRALLGELSEDALAATVAGESTLNLWLPGGPELALVNVPTLALAPTDAVDWLTSLPTPAPEACGDSVGYWARLAALIVGHVSHRQFFPDIQTSGEWAVAVWRLLVSSTTEVQNLERYAKAMPPVCRAVETSGGSRDAAALLESFLVTATDAVIRRVIAADSFFAEFAQRDMPADQRITPERKWVAALVGAAAQITGTREENAALQEQVKNWVRPLDHMRASPPIQLRLTLEEPFEDEEPDPQTQGLRLLGTMDTAPAEAAPEATAEVAIEGPPAAVDLIEPITGEPSPLENPEEIAEEEREAAEAHWRVRLEIIPLERESNPIDAEDLWAKDTIAAGVLSRNILDWRAKLKTELIRAAEVCPPFERLMQEPEPTRLKLTTLEAHAFIHQWAPALRQRSFIIVLPDWATRPERDLGLLLYLAPPAQPDLDDVNFPDGANRGARAPGSAAGHFGLHTLLDFDWRIAVGDMQLSADEFRNLAEQGTPLVKHKGQWLQFSPDAARRALIFLEQKNEKKMTLAEAFRTAYGGLTKDTGLPVLGLSGTDWIKDLLDQTPSRKMEPIAQPVDFQGTLRPYQLRGLEWMGFLDSMGIGACLADDMGLGKAQPLDAGVLTPTGYRRMGELKKGDLVIGGDGQPTRITGVYPQGIREIFRVTFSDGAFTECCDEHLWSVNSPVRKKRGNPPRVVPLAEIRGKLRDAAGNCMHFIPMVGAVAFGVQRKLPIHPYLLGVLLGDGGIAHRAIVSSADQELLDTIAPQLPEGLHLTHTGHGVDYRITTGVSGRANPLMDILRDMELMGRHSHDKFIPEAYKLASPEDRLEVLRGLLDTDGHVRPADNNIEYSSSSPQLARDVQYLVNSLGGTARIREKPTTARLSYRMSIALPAQINPFRLSRKSNTYHPREKYQPARAIVDVQSVGCGDVQCISVESPDQLYVTDGFIVTHNTIQLIAMLLYERNPKNIAPPADTLSAPINNEQSPNPHSRHAPTLLFAPTSVVGNWLREVQRFAPALRVLVHHGPLRLRGDAFVKAASEHDIVITSYALAHRDFADLRRPTWHRVALDEAQKIKNPSAAATIAIRSIHSPHRIALTGTPIENHLAELWSIMEVLNPGLLGTAATFRERFAVPIEKLGSQERAAQLRKLIQPFVLRRTKSDPTIVGDLPDKIENRVYCNLSPEQAALYEATTADMLGQIDAATGIRRRGLILAALTRLKQICDHPALVQKDGSQALDARSGKCERLYDMLEEILEEPTDAALIFTQYRTMGFLLEQFVKDRLKQIPFFLHGGTPAKLRNEMVMSFQAPESKTRIFILSLRAGGLGLNLTAANHVFHFDRWWNPAVEAQATDRAHRIGQTRKVQVHKFICVGTLEERIDRMLTEKKAVADRIVSSGDSWLTSLSTEELKSYLALSDDAVGDF